MRREADFYPTPSWCVRRLLEALKLPAGRWLEPCSGDGAIIRAVSDSVHPRWTTNDIRADAQAVYHYNLRYSDEASDLRKKAGPVDVIITNPPYSCAFKIIKNLRTVWQGSDMIMLLPLPFLSSAERREWWMRHPADLYVLPNRPSFVNGRTSPQDYAWFHWRRPIFLGSPSHGSVYHLALTPASERRPPEGRAAEPQPPPAPR